MRNGPGMHHQVAADHRQAGVGTVEADVFGAVGIDDHVADNELVIGRQARGGTVSLDQAQRAADGL